MKTRIALTAILAITALASSIWAETPSSAPAQGVDVGGFFRHGENTEAHRWTSYFALIGDKAAERQQSYHALAEKLGAPSEVLADLDAYTRAMLGYPYATAYGAWPEDVKKKWERLPNYDLTKWKPWLDKPDHEPLFFFYLGKTAFKGSFIVGREVIENNGVPKDYARQVKSIADDAGTFLSDANYAKARQRLVPEAVEALKLLETFKRFDDPLNETPLSKDDVSKLSDACKKLTSLAHENKLVAPTATGGSPQK